MLFTRTSVLTQTERTIDLPVTEEQLSSWRNGALIQDAMPNLTPDQREFLLTGVIASEWESASWLVKEGGEK